MKIYIAHSKSFNFQNELYAPIKNSFFNKEHVFVFPHNESGESFNSKEFFQKDCDLIIAEVSYPATGLGIELGWTDMLNVPIACIYKKGSKIAGSLKIISKIFFEYSNEEEIIIKIVEAIKNVENS